MTDVMYKEEITDGKAFFEIVQVIGKHYPKALQKEAEKILKPDEAVGGYEVEIEDDKKEVKLELDTRGKVLKGEANKD